MTRLSSPIPRQAGLGASAAAKGAPPPTGSMISAADDEVARLAKLVVVSLEDDKAEDIVEIDITGKSSIADRLIVASGRSQRHVGALADHLSNKLKEAGHKDIRVEGLPHCDWVLLDAGDVVVHLFRPEVRQFYQIEKIWGPATAPHA